MITLTDTAAVKVKELLEAEGDLELALRVAVRPGGCSGFSYEMFFDGDVAADDEKATFGTDPTTEVHVFLATHGWWPWLLLYAVIIGIVAAGGVYLLRRRRANKETTTTTTTSPTGEPGVAPPTEPPAPSTPPDSTA